MSPNSLGGLGSLGGELDSVTGMMGISFADPDPVMPGSGFRIRIVLARIPVNNCIP